MQRGPIQPIMSFALALILVSLACATTRATPTSSPQPTAIITTTATATQTPRPFPTPRPTRTPNLAATKQVEKWNAETQKYFDLGYLTTTDGKFIKYDDFKEESAKLGWYHWWYFDDRASNFYMDAHFRWTSAYRNADISGCGFVFDVQDNGDNYAVFLDRSKIYFIDMDQSFGYYRPVGLTRGTGIVNFDNPFDHPLEADFTLIVKDAYAYVLVKGEVVGEYTLAQSRPARGKVGPAIISGTNKGYGTRCIMTNFHLWLPKE